MSDALRKSVVTRLMRQGPLVEKPPPPLSFFAIVGIPLRSHLGATGGVSRTDLWLYEEVEDKGSQMRTSSHRHHGSRLRRHVLGIAAVVAGAGLLAACTSSANPTALQRATTYLDHGLVAQHAGDLATATIDYQKVLALYPHDLYALYDLGTVEQSLGHPASAAADYMAVLARQPFFSSGDAMYNLAIIDAATNKAQSAHLFARLVAQYPRDAVAHFHYGLELLALGSRAAGEHQINVAIGLDPALRSQAPRGS